MKSILIAMMFAAAPALALGPGDFDQEEPVTDYLSWCDGNNVIGQDVKGDLYVRANCTDAGLQCKTTQIYRLHRTIVSATCVQN